MDTCIYLGMYLIWLKRFAPSTFNAINVSRLQSKIIGQIVFNSNKCEGIPLGVNRLKNSFGYTCVASSIALSELCYENSCLEIFKDESFNFIKKPFFGVRTTRLFM